MLVLVVGVGVELKLGPWLARLAGDKPRFGRAWQTLYAPLLRSAVIVGAVLGAYPALFGFRAAPALSTLFSVEMGRSAILLGLVCLLRLLAPWLAALRARPATLDAVQSLGAVAVVFVYYADYLGAVSASAWPGLLSALALGGLCTLLPALAAGLGRDFGARLGLRLDLNGLDECCAQGATMLAVAPLTMLYGYMLGDQLGM
jgi:hypothetical protein